MCFGARFAHAQGILGLTALGFFGRRSKEKGDARTCMSGSLVRDAWTNGRATDAVGA
jgi:hypothetical protein